MHQRAELYEAGDVESTRRLETGHYLPGTCDDTNYANYFAVQFAWGKKVILDFNITRLCHSIDILVMISSVQEVLRILWDVNRYIRVL